MKPTQGPWGLRGYQIRADGGRGQHIATYQTSEADGRLLAASPRLRDLLLEALEALGDHEPAGRIRGELDVLLGHARPAKANEPSVTEVWPVLMQVWEESERGWGSRPDGCSLHLSEEDRQKFIADYWARMPAETPDEYSRPFGSARTVNVSAEEYAKLKASGHGIRLWQSEMDKRGLRW